MLLISHKGISVYLLYDFDETMFSKQYTNGLNIFNISFLTRKHSSRMRNARLCSPGGGMVLTGYGTICPLPCEQTDMCKNITFPQLHLQAVTRHSSRMRTACFSTTSRRIPCIHKGGCKYPILLWTDTHPLLRLRAVIMRNNVSCYEWLSLSFRRGPMWRWSLFTGWNMHQSQLQQILLRVSAGLRWTNLSRW